MKKEDIDRINEWETLSRRQWLCWYGEYYNTITIPDDKRIDLVSYRGKQKHIWEFKNTLSVGIEQYWDMGAMIDVSKFNTLKEYTKTCDNVWYLRYYVDGHVLWRINDLKDEDVKYYNLPRNQTSVNQSGVKADSYCISFESAYKIRDIDGNEIKK